MSEGALSHRKGYFLHCQPNPWPLLIIVVVVIIIVLIKVNVLPSWGRRPHPAIVLAAACRPFLGGEEIYDCCDDSTVFGLPVIPVHRSRVADFFL